MDSREWLLILLVRTRCDIKRIEDTRLKFPRLIYQQSSPFSYAVPMRLYAKCTCCMRGPGSQPVVANSIRGACALFSVLLSSVASCTLEWRLEGLVERRRHSRWRGPSSQAATRSRIPKDRCESSNRLHVGRTECRNRFGVSFLGHRMHVLTHLMLRSWPMAVAGSWSLSVYRDYNLRLKCYCGQAGRHSRSKFGCWQYSGWSQAVSEGQGVRNSRGRSCWSALGHGRTRSGLDHYIHRSSLIELRCVHVSVEYDVSPLRLAQQLLVLFCICTCHMILDRPEPHRPILPQKVHFVRCLDGAGRVC